MTRHKGAWSVDFAWLPSDILAPPGRLALAAGPGTGFRSVEYDLDTVAELGFNAVFCLQTNDELGAVERGESVASRTAALKERGIDAHFFTVEDFHAFEPEDLRKCLDVLTQCLDDDQSVMVHCWAGQGRTGTVAACALIDRGMSPQDALTHVRRARPGAVANPPQIELVSRWGDGQF